MDHVRDLLDGARGGSIVNPGAMRWTPPEELEER